MTITSKDFKYGNAMIHPGSTCEYETGTWRTMKPKVDQEKCIKCGRCYIFCPEGCIKIKLDNRDEKKVEINLFYCKGCGICSRECPTRAIKMEEEEEE